MAVIGAGTMGGGIALVAATAGHSVLLYDAAPGAAEAGCKRQRADLERLVTRGKLTAEDCKDRLSRLHPVGKFGRILRRPVWLSKRSLRTWTSRRMC